MDRLNIISRSFTIYRNARWGVERHNTAVLHRRARNYNAKAQERTIDTHFHRLPCLPSQPFIQTTLKCQALLETTLNVGNWQGKERRKSNRVRLGMLCKFRCGTYTHMRQARHIHTCSILWSLVPVLIMKEWAM